MSEGDELGDFLDSARSAGQLESSGRMTIDLERALKQLSRFQLSDTHDYVKTVVSTAVVGGASFLEVTSSQGVVSFRFDGQTLTQDQLPALLGLPGNRFQREFSLTWLHCLALQPSWLRLRSGAAEIRIAEGVVVVEESPEGQSQDNFLQIGPLKNLRRRLNRLVALPEFAVLREFCTFAPLQLTINSKLLRGRFDFGGCLGIRQVGDIGSLEVRARAGWELDPQPQQEGAHWSAVLVMGAEKTVAPTLLVNGVRLPLPIRFPYPDCAAVVVAPHLPLDLSRSHVAEGEAWTQLQSQLEDQFDELALQICLEGKAEELLSLLWDRHVPRLAEGFDYPFAKTLRETPLYLMANGSPQDLVSLVDQSLNDGYLGVTSRPWTSAPTTLPLPKTILKLYARITGKPWRDGITESPWAWEAGKVVVGERFLGKALHHFPCLPLDHLAQIRAVRRLPSEGSYLIRMPLLEVAGEIGLRAESPEDRYAYEVAEGPVRVLPLGVEVAAHRSTQEQAIPSLTPLYHGLVWKTPRLTPQERIWTRHHLLTYLCHLCDAATINLGELLQLGRDEVRELALHVHIPTVAGPQVSLLQLLEKSPWLYRERLGGPPHALFCNHLQRTRLLTLLGPGSLVGHGLTHFSRSVSLFSASVEERRRGRQAITTLVWLRELLAMPDCAASQVLWKLGIGREHLEKLETVETDLENGTPGTSTDAVRQASREAMEQVGKLEAFHLATDHLLLGLLRVRESMARIYLESCGVTLKDMEAVVLDNRYREALADLDRSLTSYPNAIDYSFRAEAHYYLGDHEGADEDARQALALDPDCVQARKWLGGK